MPNFHDRAGAAISHVADVGFDLMALSNAFAETGNTVMAQRLEKLSERLDHLTTELDEALNDKLRADLGASFEASTNVIRAAMAGIAVGAKELPHDLPLGPVTAVDVADVGTWLSDRGLAPGEPV